MAELLAMVFVISLLSLQSLHKVGLGFLWCAGSICTAKLAAPAAYCSN